MANSPTRDGQAASVSQGIAGLQGGMHQEPPHAPARHSAELPSLKFSSQHPQNYACAPTIVQQDFVTQGQPSTVCLSAALLHRGSAEKTPESKAPETKSGLYMHS